MRDVPIEAFKPQIFPSSSMTFPHTSVCKLIRFDGYNEGSSVHELIEEIKIMANLDHPNIIKVYEYFLSSKSIQVIMELSSGGELWDRISEKHKTGRTSSGGTRRVGRRLLQGVVWIRGWGSRLCGRF